MAKSKNSPELLDPTEMLREIPRAPSHSGDAPSPSAPPISVYVSGLFSPNGRVLVPKVGEIKDLLKSARAAIVGTTQANSNDTSPTELLLVHEYLKRMLDERIGKLLRSRKSSDYPRGTVLDFSLRCQMTAQLWASLDLETNEPRLPPSLLTIIDLAIEVCLARSDEPVKFDVSDMAWEAVVACHLKIPTQRAKKGPKLSKNLQSVEIATPRLYAALQERYGGSIDLSQVDLNTFALSLAQSTAGQGPFGTVPDTGKMEWATGVLKAQVRTREDLLAILEIVADLPSGSDRQLVQAFTEAVRTAAKLAGPFDLMLGNRPVAIYLGAESHQNTRPKHEKLRFDLKFKDGQRPKGTSTDSFPRLTIEPSK